MKYIVNGKLICGSFIVTGKALEYTDKINGIIPEDSIPEGAEIYDARGKYVSAGFVSIHAHGTNGEDTCGCDFEGMKKMCESLPVTGVTSWLPTTMTVSVPEIYSALDIIRKAKAESPSWNASTVLGANVEGPFINKSKKGAQSESNIRKPDASIMLPYADCIKLITIAPEMDEDYVCAKALTEAGIKVSIGHSDASYEKACDAIQNGYCHVTHLFNAQTALKHREPGIVTAALTNDVYTELICDTFHIHPGIFKLVAAAKKDKLCLITDSMSATGLEDGVYSLGGQTTYVKGIKCLLEDGTIAGSVLKLNIGLKNFYKYANVSLPDAVAAVTENPAKAIGVFDRKGSLVPGKDADITIFDDNFDIAMTIIGGRKIYEA